MREFLKRVVLFIHSTVYLLLGVIGIATAGAAIGVHLFVRLRGPNTSDVFLPSWENGALAGWTGDAAYLGVIIGGWRLTRPLERVIPEEVVIAGWCARAVVTFVYFVGSGFA